MDRSRLSVVIPAYNEQDTIGPVVEAALPFAEVIVVNDCSRDETAAVAARAGAHVVNNARNLGYERTLEAGFREAWRRGSEAVVTMDADGEHDPSVLPEFYRLLIEEEVPLVLGRRVRPARAAEYVFVWAMRLWFGIDDILCGCKGYRRETFEANGGFDPIRSIGTELAAASVARGYAFRQLFVPGRRRAGVPRFGASWRANARILAGLIRLVRHLFRMRLGK